jgi:hypothetical protein
MLSPVLPSAESGCKAIVLCEPPSSAFAPTPAPIAAPAEAPA